MTAEKKSKAAQHVRTFRTRPGRQSAMDSCEEQAVNDVREVPALLVRGGSQVSVALQSPVLCKGGVICQEVRS